MSKKLYVGRLPWSTTNEELENLFKPYGTVTSASVIMDRESGRSKGFGFVEMADDTEAEAAIEALNGSQMGNQQLVVNEARPMEPRQGGGFGGGNRGGNGGGGGGWQR